MGNCASGKTSKPNNQIATSPCTHYLTVVKKE